MFEFFFSPQSVAVIGASRDEEKLGHGVLKNLLQYGYKGKVYPVNPKGGEILGLKVYPSVLEVPGLIDLAVIVVPAPVVASVLEECGRKGVRGVVIITAGFREVGGEGMKEERRLVEIASRYGIRMIGPNCLGIIDTLCPLNATFARGMPEQGDICIMSQSGALLAAILDWAISERVGFSRLVSLGNKADINEIDMLEAWGDDPRSKVIAAYLEGIVDGTRFMEVASRVSQKTPIVIIKAGTTEAGAKAVSSHTGTLAGSEKAYDTALRQAGVVRANSVEDLFDYAFAFSQQPLIRGRRIAIVTNGGGVGIMASDELERVGLKMASLTRETVERLKERLPAAANVYNPVDCLGDADAERYRYALDTVLQDVNVDGVIAIFLSQVVMHVEDVAEAVGETAKRYDKPVLACLMGGEMTEPGREVLRRYGIPNYNFPERAVKAMLAIYKRKEFLDRPPREIERFEVHSPWAQEVFEQVRSEGRLTVGDAEARRVMEAYGIPLPQSVLARNPEEALEAAESIGYPVAMKIASPDILHKTDIGGVRLNIRGPDEVRDSFDLLNYRALRFMPEAEIWGVLVQEMVEGCYEVLVGMSRDPQFGPLLAFGLGGIYVEALRDVTFRIAPVARWEAREMLSEIRGYSLLRGVRGESPADLEAIVDCILRVSQLVTDFPEIVELDINPLIVCEEGKGAVAVDLRMALQ
ncbi:MAG TPA: acyl-CoA synthetase [Chloroflexi bacterium]|nr:acyl-CoA synthetase [Chloroflexota bacterium]